METELVALARRHELCWLAVTDIAIGILSLVPSEVIAEGGCSGEQVSWNSLIPLLQRITDEGFAFLSIPECRGTSPPLW